MNDEGELPLVMREIADALSARGTALTLHPDDGSKPQVIYADERASLTPPMVQRLLDEADLSSSLCDDAVHSWVACGIDHTCRDVMTIPVSRTPGHSRLLISVFFDHLNDDVREQAEHVYFTRRPFAVGYFRLWQLERTQHRRIEALETALDLTELGVILLDQSGHIVFENSAATAMLDASDGIRRSQNGLASTKLSETMRLQVVIEHVITVGNYGGSTPLKSVPTLALQRANGAALIARVLPPAKRAVEPNDVAAIVYLLDPEFEAERLLQPVAKLYQLSPVETKLACLLVAGETLHSAAEVMHVKELTARSTLKQIFIKTGTHRQADLVRVMLSNMLRTNPSILAEVLQSQNGT